MAQPRAMYYCNSVSGLPSRFDDSFPGQHREISSTVHMVFVSSCPGKARYPGVHNFVSPGSGRRMLFSTAGLLPFHRIGCEEDQMPDLFQYAPRYTLAARPASTRWLPMTGISSTSDPLRSQSRGRMYPPNLGDGAYKYKTETVSLLNHQRSGRPLVSHGRRVSRIGKSIKPFWTFRLGLFHRITVQHREP